MTKTSADEEEDREVVRSLEANFQSISVLRIDGTNIVMSALSANSSVELSIIHLGVDGLVGIEMSVDGKLGDEYYDGGRLQIVAEQTSFNVG